MSSRYALNKNKYLLEPEYQHLEMTLMRYKLKEPRNCLAIMVALKTGGRAQEVLNLRKSDMNAYDQSLFIRGLKNSSDREIPVEESLYEDLETYARPLASTDPLFDLSYHRLRQIWCDYRPIAKKFHCLRHTFAIRLYKKTRDIRLLQVALGHRNIANTMIYADYVYSQTELRRLIL
jgi:integrase